MIGKKILKTKNAKYKLTRRNLRSCLLYLKKCTYSIQQYSSIRKIITISCTITRDDSGNSVNYYITVTWCRDNYRPWSRFYT